MSRDMHICCLDCKEHLWIGQTDIIYTGHPEVMEALRQFLVKHRTYGPREVLPNGYHELIFIPEPYNGSFEDVPWKEIEIEEDK